MISFKAHVFVTFFLLGALLGFVLNGCTSLKKKTSIASWSEEEISDMSNLPSEKAAQIIIKEGWESIKRGNLNLAEQKFEKALRISPINGEGYLGLAHIAYLQQKYQAALEFLQIGEGYSLHDTDLMIRIYILKGDSYIRMGKRMKAKEAYKRGLEISPGNSLLIDRLEKMN